MGSTTSRFGSGFTPRTSATLQLQQFKSCGKYKLDCFIVTLVQSRSLNKFNFLSVKYFLFINNFFNGSFEKFGLEYLTCNFDLILLMNFNVFDQYDHTKATHVIHRNICIL